MYKKYSPQWIASIFRMRGKCENKLTKQILLSYGFNKNFKIINVVGTNGKGSVTKYLNDALIKEGFKVGKFTSPHLFKYNERITINDKEISNDEFFEIVNPILDIVNKEEIMFFPLTYIAAMVHFWRNDVDYVVLEAGVGGKDPTNIIDGDFGCLTSIAEDHMDWFKTFENISFDKSAIMNKGMKFVLPSVIDPISEQTFVDRAKSVGADLKKVRNDNPSYVERNKIIANELFNIILGKDIEEYNQPEGRLTIIGNDIYDVAHNYEGIKASVKELAINGAEYNKVVISLSANKDDSKITELFKDKEIFIYEHKGHFSKDIKDYTIKGKVINDLKKFHKENENILYIGSFFLVSEVMKYDK